MNIKYVGTPLDSSGFGSAARAEIAALWVAGVNLVCEVIHQVPEQTDLGLLGDLVNRLQGKKLNYKIKIIRLTPDMFPRHLEPNVYHIGRIVHETDKLPPTWVAACNQMDELWVTTDEREKMLRNSGVTKPISVFPEPMDVTIAEDIITPFETQNAKDFYFYSIFQWIERKNPKGLLRAYFRAFEGRDDVTLVLKTYRVTYQPHEFDLIKQDIQNLKQELGLKHYPKIYLVKKLLTENEMWKLHQMGDCYVSASSGEGWNRPLAEAALLGKPVISADCGGVTNMLSSLYYEVPCAPSQVVHDPNAQYYTQEQNWLKIDEYKLEKTMKSVFENFSQAQDKAKLAQKKVIENLSYQTVGQKMAGRLSHVDQ